MTQYSNKFLPSLLMQCNVKQSKEKEEPYFRLHTFLLHHNRYHPDKIEMSSTLRSNVLFYMTWTVHLDSTHADISCWSNTTWLDATSMIPWKWATWFLGEDTIRPQHTHLQLVSQHLVLFSTRFAMLWESHGLSLLRKASFIQAWLFSLVLSLVDICFRSTKKVVVPRPYLPGLQYGARGSWSWTSLWVCKWKLVILNTII